MSLHPGKRVPCGARKPEQALAARGPYGSVWLRLGAGSSGG